ncbi:Regulator of cell morphogenesis and NO signaling [Paraburkholderia caribensis MBA4]|uniref:Regulator of cell morphogenesis and NO signaling n=1 Tax=Paraburkholderia caribensis MBA4 TaxID=1323664 RepID=A0A0P0RJY8_9BURK|nr:hemerythrin domain-containing protein [Paraburkholderia caribensis]ALL69100.1 Regulator of cell morphogenesis and NO signaling [Paraburkholderia caribensis MBA4]
MSTLNGPVSPDVTTMIRLDHSHVFLAFHRYRIETAWWRKRAIVKSVCRALEIHARLEEEIFYPAIARIQPDNETLKKSHAEHQQMREVINRLRVLGPESAAYDALFMELMRDTIHHVADEETTLLPVAERSLKHELRTLGAEMTRRRLELLGEHPMEIALNTAGTFPVATTLLGAVVVCGFMSVLRGRHPKSTRAGRLR